MPRLFAELRTCLEGPLDDVTPACENVEAAMRREALRNPRVVVVGRFVELGRIGSQKDNAEFLVWMTLPKGIQSYLTVNIVNENIYFRSENAFFIKGR